MTTVSIGLCSYRRHVARVPIGLSQRPERAASPNWRNFEPRVGMGRTFFCGGGVVETATFFGPALNPKGNNCPLWNFALGVAFACAHRLLFRFCRAGLVKLFCRHVRIFPAIRQYLCGYESTAPQRPVPFRVERVGLQEIVDIGGPVIGSLVVSWGGRGTLWKGETGCLVLGRERRGVH